MANVIKHKRGSGSDPGASDLVVGEVAIRTDVGKLFTKMDNGSVAEIAGGGSDIAINTLSSSSATGGGSATFNGSAYRFTLSAPPSVSAQQLLVSINGVIQKPVAGTGQPSEGFSVDGTDIILGDAPATGADFFILTFKSLGVSEPADNSVTSAKIADGAIVNADINASAAIARTKLANVDVVDDTSPQLGGGLASNGFNINFADSNGAQDMAKFGNSGDLRIYHDGGHSYIDQDGTGSLYILADTFRLNNEANTENIIAGNANGAVELYFDNSKKFETTTSGVSITGAITGTGDLTIDTNTLKVDSSNNRVGIATASPTAKLHIVESASTPAQIIKSGTSSNQNVHIKLLNDNDSGELVFAVFGSAASTFGNITATDGVVSSNQELCLNSQNASGAIKFGIGSTPNEKMRIDSSGNVGIGQNNPDSPLEVVGTGPSLTTIWKSNGATNDEARIMLGALSSFQPDQRGAGIAAVNNGAGHDLIIKCSASHGAGPGEKVRVTSAGNVGIGTTSPQSILSAKVSASRQLDVIKDSGDDHLVLKSTAPDASYNMRSIELAGTDVSFSTGASSGTSYTERMRIDSSGRVGIGSSSPTEKLEINLGTDKIVQFTGGIGQIGNVAGVFAVNTAKSEIADFGIMGNTLKFASGTATGGAERMRINSAGNVGIGGTAPNYQLHCTTSIGVGSHGFAQQLSITNNKIQSLVLGTGYTNMTINALGGLVGIRTGTTSLAASLHVENGGSGNVVFLKHASSGIAVTLKLQNNRATGSLAGEQISFCDDTGTQRGKITNTTATTTYHTSSDYRLKENEVLISDGIERIKQLKPYKFSWKHIPNKIVDGFFAHEVENLVEDCVDGIKDRVVTKEDHDKGDYTDKEIGTEIHQMMDHSKLVPLLVAALQEAIGRIEALEAG